MRSPPTENVKIATQIVIREANGSKKIMAILISTTAYPIIATMHLQRARLSIQLLGMTYIARIYSGFCARWWFVKDDFSDTISLDLLLKLSRQPIVN